MTLVNAVRNAEAGSSYPDYYRGTSNAESAYPGARFPVRRGALQSYRDADNPAVPAFTFTSDQILTGMRRFDHGGDFIGFMGNHVAETANRHTINIYNKRSLNGSSRSRPAKKAKNSGNRHTAATNYVTIDLTQDDLPYGSVTDTYIHPSRRDMVPKQGPGTRSSKVSQQSRTQYRIGNQDRNARAQTTEALNDISRTLSKQMAELGRAREILKNRWDQDHSLQVQSVTDDLGELNQCFGRMEDAGRDSLGIIQDQLQLEIPEDALLSM